MLKGFKDFLFRGNLIELATAFVIGGAFTALVNSFTSAIITPVLNSFGGKNATQGLGFRIIPDNKATFVDLSTIINAVIVFFLTAVILYFLFIVPYEHSKKLIGIQAAAPEETDKDILSDIRELLRGNQATNAEAIEANSPPVADPADG